MKRIFLSALVALIIPLSASALSVDEIRAQIQTLMQQIQQLQEQMKTLTNPTTTLPVACAMDAKICPDGSTVGRIGPRCEFTACPGGDTGSNIPPAWCMKYEKLTYGARGAEVLALQGAIGADQLGSIPTGYYGPLTKSIWDRKCRKVCPVYEYNGVCPTGQHMVTDPNNCNKPSCVPDGTTTSPLTISGVSGPSMLTVGEQGTWTVKAVAASAGTLSYSVTWGDEGPFAQIAALADGANTFTQSATFAHTYVSAGTYTVRFTARDSVGKTADTSLTVRVGVVTSPKTCPPVTVVVDCAPGYHPMNRYGDNGCVVGNTCVSDGPITAPTGNTLSAMPTTGVAPLTVTFAAHGGYTVDFGDGAVASCQDSCSNWQTTHTYAAPGTYVAHLAGQGGGCPDGAACANVTPIAEVTITVSNSGCVGPQAGGMSNYTNCISPQVIQGNLEYKGGPITGGMDYYQANTTCTANGMTFAEGATVSQCIASGGAYGCNTFTVVEPRSVCRGGVWVQ